MPLDHRTLTTAALAQVSASAFAPTGPECVGLELEWPVHRRADVEARPNADDVASLEKLALPAGGRITFEPGGQVELSTAPARCVAEVLPATEIDSRVLRAHLDAAGFVCETLAVDDRRNPRRILTRPRYQAMEAFFAEQGPAGAWMMCNTAATQVSVSYDSNDPHQRWHTMHLIAPALIAAFANSPGRDARGHRWVSLRQAIWWSIDPHRTRPVPTDAVPEQAWQDYALAADVMFINAEGSCDASGTALKPGLPFGRWMADGHDTGWPTIEDYRYHLTTLFPPVRPRGWLELRVLDALPPWIRDVAVLVVVSACSADASREIRQRLPDTTGLWLTARRDGLDHPVLEKAARILVEVATEHLGSVTMETHHGDIVEEYAARYVRRGCAPGAELRRDTQEHSRRRAPDLTPI